MQIGRNASCFVMVLLEKAKRFISGRNALCFVMVLMEKVKRYICIEHLIGLDCLGWSWHM